MNNNAAIEKEKVELQGVHKEHEWLTQTYRESGLADREAVSKAWDFLLDRALSEMRQIWSFKNLQ